MKISIYITLLLAFILLASPCRSQDNKYKKANNVGILQNNGIMSSYGIRIDTIPVAKLDGVLKNMSGVVDIIQGNKSLMHPDVVLDPNANLSVAEALVDCAEAGKAWDNGKVEPTPDISGLPMVRRKGDVLIGPSGILPKLTSSSSTSKPDTKSPEASASSSPFQHLLDAEEKPSHQMIRSVQVKVMESSYQVFLKKYSIVIGSFKNLSNADFVRRTFNGIGERAIVVENNVGIHYVLLAGTDNQAEAIQKLDDFNKKYTAGLSRAKLMRKYGVPLDDLWILNNE